MVARLLRRAGHTVSEAVDGVAAVSMVSRTLIDRTTAVDRAARWVSCVMDGWTRLDHPYKPHLTTDRAARCAGERRCPAWTLPATCIQSLLLTLRRFTTHHPPPPTHHTPHTTHHTPHTTHHTQHTTHQAPPRSAMDALHRSSSSQCDEASVARGLKPFDVVLMDGNMPRCAYLASIYIAPI